MFLLEPGRADLTEAPETGLVPEFRHPADTGRSILPCPGGVSVCAKGSAQQRFWQRRKPDVMTLQLEIRQCKGKEYDQGTPRCTVVSHLRVHLMQEKVLWLLQ